MRREIESFKVTRDTEERVVVLRVTYDDGIEEDLVFEPKFALDIAREFQGQAFFLNTLEVPGN